ncbi:tetratricopeptide repeat protein [Psychrobium sp. 1_MG-2023]|uniref:YfgM family protein n=1 Tax=Psychrobium sp. 1_MG-2023 TaxID=3062624 RepID=UPI000C3485DB|nr:tetratricopeptide repeat protein [Psychrobium sp. 1_MG-2023]MDP2559915.1 tetratricopeptide repeat protein [Psychrobium sp. 1_MG-2023]PKF58984.1 hypothetical protein CW748_02005 [Alteromonadales bacterium alter-6D02]
MEIYSSEEQQEEAIKRFLKENGPALVIGALVGLGGIYGWNYYQQAKLDTIAENSLSFSKVSDSTEIVAEGEKFVAEHSGTQYSQLTQLLMVKSLVEKKEFDKASAVLKEIIDSSVEPAVKNIAVTRLARIELELQQYDQAVTTLNTIKDSAFDVQKNELIGDALVAKGDLGKARAAYQAAVDAAGAQAAAELQMKLNDLTPAV